MSLVAGTRLGPYEVLSAIGAGGMGEVYRARDTTLNREVALKFLPESFAHDTDRLVRFTREAQTLAALNHPRIAAIYGLEENGRARAIVMELVEGEDLSQRIARGAIPLDEALPIAKQIADALEAAHAQGIIHRDLKPANIKVRADGTVKVLDFGLAKAMDPRPSAPNVSRSSTIITPCGDTQGGPPMMTGIGMVLGTAAYMSPEQARGTLVDRRADLWAFGVVLWEMLTGTRPFAGATVSDTLAAVLKTEPGWNALPPATPSAIRRLLRRCLEKDCKRRLADAADARLEIEDALTTGNDAAALAAEPRPFWKRALPAVGTSVVVGLITALAVLAITRPVAPASQRLSIVLPANRPVGFGRFPNLSIALSPDATQVAYVGPNSDGPPGPASISLHTRALGSLAVRDLPGTADAHQPFFSPDGQWVAFFTSTGDLRKIALNGGNPVTLLEKINSSQWAFGAWTDDHTIIFSGGAGDYGLRRVSADGGTPSAVTSLDAAQGEIRHLGPDLVAGTHAVLFTVVFGRLHDPRIEAVQLETGERRVVVEHARNGRYLRGGHLLFQRDDVILVAPFDPTRLALIGSAVPLVDEVRRDGGAGEGALAQLVVSRTGTLAYVPAVDTTRVLGLVSRTGAFAPLGVPANRFDSVAVSPDGQSVAYDVTRGPGDAAVYVYDRARGSTSKLTQGGSDEGPSWHPNGRAVAVVSRKPDGSGIFLKELGGTERLLVPSEGTTLLRNMSWSPDGALLAYTSLTNGASDIWVVTTADKPVAHPLLNTPASEHSPRFSPDGRWLAYVSDESGRDEVYIREYPQGERLAASTNGAISPAWSRDGKALFFQGTYEGAQKLLAATVSVAKDTLRIGKPAPLFDLRVQGPTGLVEQYAGRGAGQRWDVFPDGQHFLMSRGADPQGAREIVLVQHWFEELKRLVPTK